MKPGKLKVGLFWLCGIESNLKQKDIAAEIPIRKVDTSIQQSRFWSVACDINAVIAIALSGFVIAFLNKYN